MSAGHLSPSLAMVPVVPGSSDCQQAGFMVCELERKLRACYWFSPYILLTFISPGTESWPRIEDINKNDT